MYDAVSYQKSFLKQVIMRVDFVAALPDMEKALPPKLAKSLSASFPIAEPQDSLSFQVTFGGAEPKHTQTPFKQWNFFGKEREKQLSVAPQFMFIVYSQYTSYDEMRATVAAVISAIGSNYPDVRAARFGLRFINGIEIDNVNPVTDWHEYIAPALVSATSFFEATSLTRMIQIAETKCGEIDVRFQFGMPNPDYPALIKRPSFMLDFDAYVQTAHDLASSLSFMDQSHKCIQALFERSISDKLRERMNVRVAPTVQ